MKLLIVTFWIIIFVLSMHTLPRTLDVLQSKPIDNFRLVRIVTMAIAALLVAYPLFSLRYIELAFRPPLSYLLLYNILGFASLIYSPLKALTLWKSIEILVVIGLSATLGVIFLNKGVKKFLTINTIFLCSMIIIMEIEAIINPAAAFRWYYEGIFRMQLGGILPNMNPSPFGYTATVASVMAFASLLYAKGKQKLLYGILFSLSAIGTILSHSRTAMVAFVIATVAILLINKKTFIAIAILLCATATIFIIPQTKLYWMRQQDLDLVMNMTGRISAWPLILETSKKSPIYGYGFYAAQRFMFNSDTTDNFFLDIFIGLGFLGLFTMVLLILSVWRNIIILIINSLRTNNILHLEISSKLAGMLLVISITGLTTRGFSIHSESFMVFVTIITSIMIMRYGVIDETEEELLMTEENLITQVNVIEK
ncbi:MAG: O-antigen ligase family protein [Candidatus Poribacteria bacterium]